MREIDAAQIQKAAINLGDALLDAREWPRVLDGICRAVGATGAVMLQGDVRTPDVPMTDSLTDLLTVYFRDGWHGRDIRAARGVPLLLSGAPVVVDQDILTSEEMRRDSLYNEVTRPLGFQWFAALGFRAGSAMWGCSVQRTIQEGPFGDRDKRAMALLSPHLTEVATLATTVGRAALSAATDTLQSVRQAAVAVDRLGFVLGANASAEMMFDDELRVRNKRLFFADPDARKQFDTLTDRMRVTPDFAPLKVEPFVVSRKAQRPVVVRVLPVPAAARNPFLGARALLTLTVLEPNRGPSPNLLMTAFQLSPAEARLASIIAEGTSPEQAAEQLGLARETVRNQLKAVFAKTDTHRQAELIALLAKL